MNKLIDKLKTIWGTPKYGFHNGVKTPIKLICEFQEGIHIPKDIYPPEFIDFLSNSNGAELFKDSEFGQWGLKIFSLDELKLQNDEIKVWRDDLSESDLIIGYFLGDSDLVVLSLSKEDFGDITICTPMELKEDWHHLNMNFEEFLQKYSKGDGDKFWES
jgi:hypothetical protein